MSRKKRSIAPSSAVKDTSIINSIWYTDAIVTALIGQMPGDNDSFKYTKKGSLHTFITYPTSGTDAKSTNIDYFLDADKQPTPKKGDHRTDVFMHPLLFSTANESARIFIPYCTHQHWQLCEVNIKKTGKKFTVTVVSHDPKGGGKLEDALFKRLQATITKKLQKIINGAEITFTNEISTYTPRQAVNDNDSCGVIMIRDLERRSKNQDLNTAKPFTAEEITTLRQEHLTKLRGKKHYEHLVRQFSGETSTLFREAINSIEELVKTKNQLERQNHSSRLVQNLSKLPAMEIYLHDTKLVFYGSTKQPHITLTKSIFGPSLKISCDPKGEYIVEVQRINAHGALLPNCIDILHYKDGKLQQATTIGNLDELSTSRSRVGELLDQSKWTTSVKTPTKQASWVSSIRNSIPFIPVR
jgi:hypothetical protein